MTGFDAIVIGAGINGLIAGAVLARQGRSVCILEQRADLGGMATLAEDDGPALAHLLYNLSPTVLREIGLDPSDPLFRAQALPSVSLAETGKHVVLRGHDATYADGTPHPDAPAARRLLAQMSVYGDLLRQLAEAPPPGGDAALLSARSMRQLWRLGRFGLGVKRLGQSEMRRFLQVLLSNAHDLICDNIPDGPLAGLLAADAVRGSATGPRSPGTVFNLIYRLGHGGAAAAPPGGMPAVIAAVAEAARRAGCRIDTSTTVTRIEIAQDAVTGVVTGDGTRLSAPLVLAGSGPRAVLEMAGPAHLDVETTRRIRNIRARGTAAKVNLRLSAPLTLPGLPDELSRARLIHAPSADHVETAFNPAKYGAMSEHPVIEAVQTVTPDGANWLSAIVQYAPSDLAGGWTEAARDRLLQVTLATLTRVAPDLPALVEHGQVFTPDRIASATGAPGGHWHHAEMALDQVLSLRPANGLGQYRIGPGGLYLCGASSHPGGDVMGLAGRNAARAALEGLA